MKDIISFCFFKKTGDNILDFLSFDDFFEFSFLILLLDEIAVLC